LKYCVRKKSKKNIDSYLEEGEKNIKVNGVNPQFIMPANILPAFCLLFATFYQVLGENKTYPRLWGREGGGKRLKRTILHEWLQPYINNACKWLVCILNPRPLVK
jgi:hypothetical protein